uniref:Ig-like domain-containing protein n=1 Tax=Anas platyrhynchos TaxID=8839 RepID=A0A8B9T273_ANAPL
LKNVVISIPLVVTFLCSFKKQQKPFFKKKLTSLRLKQFGPAHFECRLTPIGDPTMVVEWLHDGKPLEAANRLRMINEFGYCSLDYGVAYSRDSGVITCRATNKYGTDHTSATLIVKDEKSLVEESQLPEGRRGLQRIEELERMAHEGALPTVAVDQKEKQKPELVLVPEPARVLEGETARFRCRVTGYPLPKVNWYLNGQLIHRKLVFAGNDHSLILPYVSMQDEGKYTCMASNVHGEAECSAHLHVQQRVPGAPCFARTPDSVQCAPGFTAVFEYIVAGEPCPNVEWFKGTKQLFSDALLHHTSKVRTSYTAVLTASSHDEVHLYLPLFSLLHPVFRVIALFQHNFLSTPPFLAALR